MSTFAVTTGHLISASTLLLGDEITAAALPADAAADTPAAGAWSDFAGSGERVVSGAHTAITDLSRSVSLAARIYEMADERSADSMQVVE
jgi:hypothetical protein